jgi:hypothetical protein
MADGTVTIRNEASGDCGVEIIQSTSPIVPPFIIRNADGTPVFFVNTNGNAFVAKVLQNVRTVTATGAAAATDSVILVDCTAGPVTLTLVPAVQTKQLSSAAASKTLKIIKIDATVNILTITRAGADTINGLVSIVITSQNQQVDLLSDGVSKWFTLPQAWNIGNNVTTVTTAYTVTNGDYKILANATGGAFTITLPAASAVPPGWEVRIEKTDASGNAVTISRAGADTIEGATTVSLAAQFNITRLTSDGTSIWYKL